ncbi:MAG TPA: HEAT repeat domain-containing protein [Terriglobia bacterium]|nr:HEAT repeat domain-containing protein [Terriglobia bacterium]
MEGVSNLTAARSFARSLNILLKTVRLYGGEHERSSILLESAWEDLRSALKASGEAGLLIGVSGNQILLDGVPLEKRPTDRSFAQLLNSAGLASINFSHRVTVEDFWRLVRAFSSAAPKTGPIATELRALLGGDKGAIRVNEVRFVAQDASLGDAGLAAQLAARSLGADAQKLQSWLQEPQRLLQLIAAAEGARSHQGGPGTGPGDGPGPGAGPGPGQGVPGGPGASAKGPAMTGPAPKEDDVFRVLRWLSQLGQTANHPDSAEQIDAVESNLHQLPQSGQVALAQALMSMSSQSDPPRPDDPLLLQLAERVAVRFALDRYEHGDAKTNAVVELLDRLKREIGSLRGILKAHEEKMGQAGMDVESHADILDRQFWAQVPERAKRKMLLSPEAWAVPPRNVRQFVEQVLDSGDVSSARAMLDNYAQCVHMADVEARRKASAGLAQMADLFSRVNHSLLKSTLHHMGEALTREGNADLQTLLGASFVRFSHEAAARRQYPAVHEALQAMENLEQRQPGLARLLWPRVKVGNPLPEFIEEALSAPRLPDGLLEVLRRMPHATVDQVAARIPRCARREEWERLLEMVEGVGPEGVAHLSRILQTRPAAEAANKVALLSRLEPRVLDEWLPPRLRDWDPMAHDVVVRQLANGMAPGRGKLLDKLYDLLDANVRPEAVDELGMSGDSATSPRLMHIVEKESSDPTQPYLQIKAIEALGRLREGKAEPLLRPLAESKRFWGWKHPREVRITAMQALKKIDPEWAERFQPKCGLSRAELNLAALDPEPGTPWIRQRRYERVNLPRPLSGMVHAEKGIHKVSLQQLSLGGGVAKSQCHIKPGCSVPLEIQSGFRRIRADVLVRESRPQELTFELVRIAHEDRNRLRRPLAGFRSQAN